MAEDEWMTIQDVVNQTGGIPYAAIRSAIFRLNDHGIITVRHSPVDARVLEIPKNALPTVRQALGLPA